MQMTASARSTGQTGEVTSSSSGGMQVRKLRRDAPGRNAAKRGGIAIGRLPRDARKRSGEMHAVLAGAAGNFEHDTPRRQDAAQHRQDRIAVARDRRRGLRAAHNFTCHNFSCRNRISRGARKPEKLPGSSIGSPPQ